MNTYYASLTGPLLGLYYPVKADDEMEARLMLNSSRLKSLWCETYSLQEANEQCAKWGGQILNLGTSLDYDAEYVKAKLAEVA